MEWESKFSSIVRETESNLAKVKQRLALGNSVPANGMSAGITSPGAGPITGWETDLYEPRMSNNLQSMDSLVRSDGHLPLESSPGVMAVIQDKIETQASTIENINRTVQQLQTEKDFHHQHVSGLRDEIALLNSRLAERGVDLQTERKMEKWKHEMMSEMQMMKSQLELYRARDNSSSFFSSMNGRDSISSDLLQLKNFMKEQFESIHHEINSIRIRLNNVESNLVGVATENRNLKDSHLTLDKNIEGLTKSHRSTAQELASKIGEHSIENQDISELKSSIKSLSNSLERLETRLKESSGSRTDSYHKRMHKTHCRKQAIDIKSPEPETSDFDLDSTETDYDFADLKSSDDLAELRSSELSVSPNGIDKYKGSNILGTLSALDLGDVSTADDLSDGDPLSVDDL